MKSLWAFCAEKKNPIFHRSPLCFSGTAFYR